MSLRADIPVGHAHALKCELACEVLREFGSLRFVATGWSMLPSIWPEDTLMVERVQPQQIHIGDVVLLGRDGRLCAHRVVSTPDGSGNPRWITRGDAMSAPDRPVIESELLGRVAYLIRAGKCIPVRAEVSVAGQLTARLVRRSVPAARALVYIHGKIQGRRVEAQKRSVSACPS